MKRTISISTKSKVHTTLETDGPDWVRMVKDRTIETKRGDLITERIPGPQGDVVTHYLVEHRGEPVAIVLRQLNTELER